MAEERREGKPAYPFREPALLFVKSSLLAITTGSILGTAAAIKRGIYKTEAGDLLSKRIFRGFALTGLVYGASLAAYLLARKQDDMRGRALSGCAAGFAVGALSSNPGIACVGCGILGGTSVLAKFLVDALQQQGPSPALSEAFKPLFKADERWDK